MESPEKSVHASVLLNETIEGLNLSDGATVLDGTFGGGGHSAEICKRFSSVKIIALDKDKGAWVRAKDKFKGLDCKVDFHNINFKDLGEVLEKEDKKEVDGIILDLGLSSDQLDNSGRGFSFLKDEPLLMTMKENPEKADLTAEDIVNTWSEENLASIIYGYGEERFSRRIAKAVVDARMQKHIKTTFDLVKIISEAVPSSYRRGRLHFATRTFQALRIAVNDELGSLQIGLQKSFKFLKHGGRLAVISFHSLEDRIVKNYFKELAKINEAKLINKKPITASIKETKENPRARSAKLRILEKI